jgi:hypothetical protein
MRRAQAPVVAQSWHPRSESATLPRGHFFNNRSRENSRSRSNPGNTGRAKRKSRLPRASTRARILRRTIPGSRTSSDDVPSLRASSVL